MLHADQPGIGRYDSTRAAISFFPVTDPLGEPYQPYVDNSRLQKHLARLRTYAIAADGRRLLFDHLRHSAVTDGSAKGAGLDDLAALTAYVSPEMNRRHYLQAVREKMILIARLRGIIR